MNKKNKKINDLFFIYKDKIIAILFLGFFVWVVFGSFVILANNSYIFARQQPQIVATNFKKDKLLSENKNSIKTFVLASSTYPVAVMYDNHSLARPQSGLAMADVIYEAPVEGGATRLMAIFNFNKQIDEIGPVRSARPYFVNWAAEYNALYVHAGGSPEALQLIKRSPIYDLNEISGIGTLYFYRHSQKSAPHNLFTSSGRLLQALENFSLQDRQIGVYDNFFYQVNEQPVNEPIKSLSIDFADGLVYDADFRYDSETGFFTRYQNNQIKYDGWQNLPIQVANIIVQIIPTETVVDNVGRLSLDIVGKGRGYLWQKSGRQEINWEKTTEYSSTEFYNQGKEIILLPGLTWILVVPSNRDIIWN